MKALHTAILVATILTNFSVYAGKAEADKHKHGRATTKCSNLLVEKTLLTDYYDVVRDIDEEFNDYSDDAKVYLSEALKNAYNAIEEYKLFCTSCETENEITRDHCSTCNCSLNAEGIYILKEEVYENTESTPPPRASHALSALTCGVKPLLVLALIA